MKVQDLLEGTEKVKVMAFLSKGGSDPISKMLVTDDPELKAKLQARETASKAKNSMAAVRQKVQTVAAEFGVKATLKGVPDKDLPGFDLTITGEKNAVTKFVQKMVMAKGTSLEDAAKFVEDNEYE